MIKIQNERIYKFMKLLKNIVVHNAYAYKNISANGLQIRA